MIEISSTSAALFAAISAATLFLFYRIASQSKTQPKLAMPIAIGLLLWLGLQAALTLQNVYNTSLEQLPPKLALLGIFPMLALLLWLFFSRAGKAWIDSLPLGALTWLHMIRIPVEIGLYHLFLEKAIPEIMTFEGRNFDILAGLSAPVAAYFGVARGQWSRQALLIWNLLCLGLLFNIVVHAVLAAPTPIQQFGFEQPNLAILNFPVSWLPTFIVPVVLFCQLAAIRQLRSKT